MTVTEQKQELKQEHTGSWYAATVNEKTDYPELKGEQTADICIVGGGFTGVASALTLAERGYSVALVEANRIGWGASGRNGGQLIAGLSGERKVREKYGASYEKMLFDLNWRGNDIVHERVEKYGIDCDLKPGFLEVASKERQMQWVIEEFDQLEKYGHPHEFRLLDKNEVSEASGTEAYVGGFLTMRNGHLHPLNLCIGEARAAAGLGVQIFEQSPVVDIVHGKKPRVVTDQGHVVADQVILAGNAYHNLEQKKLGGLVFPAGVYMLATEVLDEETRHRINPQDLAICEMNEILEYWRLAPDGRMLFGGRCNYSGREPQSIANFLKPWMDKLYPQLANVKVEYAWGGKIGIVVNRIPVVGRMNNNVWYCQGYSGHGVNGTHIMGEVLADAIGGTMEVFDMWSGMNHFKIPGSRTFGNQMLALGMLYYRLKDKLP